MKKFKLNLIDMLPEFSISDSLFRRNHPKKKSTDLYRLCFVLFFVFEVHDYNLIDQSILIDTKQKTKQIGKKINQNRLII